MSARFNDVAGATEEKKSKEQAEVSPANKPLVIFTPQDTSKFQLVDKLKQMSQEDRLETRRKFFERAGLTSIMVQIENSDLQFARENAEIVKFRLKEIEIAIEKNKIELKKLKEECSKSVVKGSEFDLTSSQDLKYFIKFIGHDHVTKNDIIPIFIQMLEIKKLEAKLPEIQKYFDENKAKLEYYTQKIKTHEEELRKLEIIDKSQKEELSLWESCLNEISGLTGLSPR